MKKIFIVLFCLISLLSKGQVYQEMPQYGYRANRMIFDSTLSIPTTCGVPTLKSNITKKAAIAFDSCNNKFYKYNPKTLTWSEISGSSLDTTSLSNRINSKADTSALNLKLNISDTANKWVNSVTKLDDSTLRVIKGTATTDLTITGVSYATKLKTQVYNNSGSTIAKGSVVYINGRHSSNLPTILLAEGNNEANSYKTFALVENDITNNNSGIVIQAGNIGNLNLPTSTYTDGDILYLSPTVPGGYTTTKSLAPNHICKLGSVTRAHPTQGSIEIKIENGWQLDELSDVQIPLVPNDSTLLQFSRVDSLWHSVSVTNAIGTKYLKPTDTASLSSRINTKLNASDTSSLSNRINLKLNISDTSTMLSKYLRKTDTASLSTRIDARVKYTDTASMLSTYQTQLNTKTTDWYVTLGQQAMGSTIKSICLIAPTMQMVGTIISLTSQQVRFVAVYLPQAATITGVKWVQQTNGSYTASNYNGVGLYTYSGGTLTLVTSSTNDNACWSQGGSTMNSKAFSSTYSASAGLYFIGAMYSASAAGTVPTLMGTSTLTNASMSMDLTNSAKLSGQVSTLTALPSTQAMSGVTLNGNGFAFWLY